MRLLVPALLLAVLVGCDASAPSSDALSVRYVVDGQAEVTFLADDGPATAHSDGRWEARRSADAAETLTLEAVSTNGSPITTTIEVDGRVVATHRGLRVRSDSRPGERSQNEVEVEGTIEAVGADRVTVQGLVFVVDASTRLLGRDNQPIPFAAFPTGTFIEAEGNVQADGTVRAKKLKLEDSAEDDDNSDDDDSDEEHEVEVNGAIDALTATSITVSGTVFATTDATRWLDDNGDPISRDAFAPGLRAEAEGWVRDGVLTAEKVKLDDD